MSQKIRRGVISKEIEDDDFLSHFSKMKLNNGFNDFEKDRKNWLTRGTKPPKPYQIKVVTNLMKAGVEVFSALHPMGSGKTLTAILACEAFLENEYKTFKALKKAIIVAPASLIQNFYSNLEGYGRSPDYISQYYAFFSPENAASDVEGFRKACQGNIVIIDEFHTLKTKITVAKGDLPNKEKQVLWLGLPVVKGKCAAAVILGAQLAKKVLVLSGTIVVNSEQDLQNLAFIHERGPLEDSMFSGKIKLLDDELRDALFELLKGKISYLDQSFVKKDMPTYTDTVLLLEMPKLYLREYMRIENEDQLAKEMMGDLTKEEKELRKEEDDVEDMRGRGAFDSNVRMVASCMKGDLNIKIGVALQLIKLRGTPAIIATLWLDRGCEPCCRELERYGFRYALLTGKQTDAEKKKSVEDYNNGKLDVIVLSKSGSTGISLKGTKTLVNLNSHWSAASKDQTLFRGIRVGSHSHLPVSERHVWVYNLLLVKPEEAKSALEQIKEYIREGVAGAPHKVRLLCDPTDYARPEPNGILSTDLALFEIQMKKARISRNVYTELLEKASIERN